MARSARATVGIARVALLLLCCTLLFPVEGRTQDPAALLAGEKFEELDKLANELWQSKTKDADGEWVVQHLYDALSNPDDDSEEGWKALLQRLERWLSLEPGSASARAVYGEALVGYAWHARGGGYASSVGKERFRLFRERLHQARQVLEEGLRLPDKVPGLHAALLTVALGESWERDEYERLFAAAVAFEPTYYPFYYRKALRLQVRWFGKFGEWERFALESAESLRATHGLALYALIVKSVLHLYGPDLFRENALAWSALDESLRDLRKLAPESLFYRSFHTWGAWVMQDRGAARKVGIPSDHSYHPALWSQEEAEGFEAWLQRVDTDDDLRARLDSLPIRLRLDHAPLAEFLRAAGELGDLTVVLDEAIRTGAAPDPYLHESSFVFEDVTLGWALDQVARDRKLAYGISGGALYFTTPERLAAIPEGGAWSRVSPSDSPERRGTLEKLGKAQAVRGVMTVAKALESVTATTGVAFRLDGVEPGRELSIGFAARPLADLIPILAFQLNADAEAADPATVVFRARKSDAPAQGKTANEAEGLHAVLRMIRRAEAALQGKIVGRGKDYVLAAELFAPGLEGLGRVLNGWPPEERKAFLTDPGILYMIKLAWYDYACALSVCSAGKRDPNGPAEAIADDRARELRDRAFAALATSFKFGWSREHALQDGDLDPLHDDPRWQQTLAGKSGK